jgi:hypothetical protein
LKVRKTICAGRNEHQISPFQVFRFVQKSILAGGRLQILPAMVKIDEVDDGATEVFHARFSVPLSKTREMCLLQHNRPNFTYEGQRLHVLAATSVFGHEVRLLHSVLRGSFSKGLVALDLFAYLRS